MAIHEKTSRKEVIRQGATRQEAARRARLTVLEMIYRAQSSHIGSCFSSADLLAILFERLDFEKDEFIASKGWCAALVYALQASHGIIPKKNLKRFCQPGEKDYIGLIEPRGRFGSRFAGGSMGMGIAAGVGFALARKWDGRPGRVWVLESDGGMNVGITWEAAALAAHHRLNNLTVICDINLFQAMGRTKDILNMEPLDKKWRAFGWDVLRLPGHDLVAVERGYEWAERRKAPSIILADTVKGKGWKRAENNNDYHYLHVTKSDYAEAKAELKG